MRTGPELLDDGLSWLASGVWTPLRTRTYWPILRRGALLGATVVGVVLVLEVRSPWNVADPGWGYVLLTLFWLGFVSVWVLSQEVPWAWVRVLATVVAVASLPVLALSFLLDLAIGDPTERVEVIGRVEGTSIEVRELYDDWDGQLLRRSLVVSRHWGPFVQDSVIADAVVGDVRLSGAEIRHCQWVGDDTSMAATTFDPVSLEHVTRPAAGTC